MTKKLLLTFMTITGLSIGTVSAQFSRPISIGIGAGAAYGLADIANSKFHPTWYGEGDYLINPFISVGLQAQQGTLSGAGFGSSFKNRFYTGNVNAKLRMGQFMGLPDNFSYFFLTANNWQRIVSNIYVGAGVGMMKNRIEHQISHETRSQVTRRGGTISTELNDIHFIVPLNIGVDIPFGHSFYGTKWAVNVNYQHSIAFSDNIDGIIDQEKDQFGVFSVGLKYALFNRK